MTAYLSIVFSGQENHLRSFYIAAGIKYLEEAYCYYAHVFPRLFLYKG